MPITTRKTPALFLVSTLVLVLVAQVPVRAAEPFAKVRVATRATVLDFPRGIRNIGMGSTGAASVSQPANGYFNPASLAWADGLTLSGEYQDFAYESLDPAFNLSDIRASVGTQRPAGWSFGGLLGYSAFRAEPQIVRTIYLPDGTGETFDVDDYYLTVLGAAAWTRGVATVGAGVSGKYLSLNGNDAWLLDLGVLVALAFRPDSTLIRPRVGVSVSNLDSGWGYDGREYDLGDESRIGIGLDIASRPIGIAGRRVPVIASAVDVDWVFQPAQYADDGYWAIGWEVSAADLLQVRIGQESQRNLDKSAYGFGLGWTFGRWMIRGDYARESWDTFLGHAKTDAFGVALGARL
ncbi:MAG TPA: hypothetical protein VFX92_00200 [Candidatus Krumholzibacteria bacterium]|nr:hypothetical protein [Candidatus Krumholzibacteria bacterium]